MPQIFDKIEELALVDWETIVIYSCINTSCIPEEFYQEEFAYIQISEDFKNVRYGEDSQIQEQKRAKQKLLEQMEQDMLREQESGKFETEKQEMEE